MATFYTRTGDSGETSLYTGERVPKHCLRLDSYGICDEVQAFLGLARAQTKSKLIAQDLFDVESKLMDVMAELASIGGEPRISSEDVEAIERRIDFYTDALPEGFKWSVPGDSLASANLHVARTITRRAERTMCQLNTEEEVSASLLKFINRISDLCYAMARYEDEVA